MGTNFKSQPLERIPVAVFAMPDPWMREMVRTASPPDFEVRFIGHESLAERQSALPDADFLMTWYLPADWVPLLKRCLLVQTQGVGYDRVAVDALAQAGIPLAVTPEGTVNGVAEHTVLLMLALSKRLCEVSSSMRRGEFDNTSWRQSCHMIFGRTVGIVGFGRIGKRVAHLLQSFDVQLVYFDLLRADVETEAELGARFAPLEELLSVSDIVTVHTPLTSQTKLLFGAAQFSTMKGGALFVHTGRGGTYDMDALFQSLSERHLGGAGLDVFNPEPPPANHPILTLDNVICTPHMAAGTVEAHGMKARAQFENFRRVWKGSAPANQVKEQSKTGRSSLGGEDL